MRNPIRRSRRASGLGERGAERVTVGLALLAVGTLGALVAGEVTRLVKRRRESGEVPTPDTIVDVAGLATRDTIAVARRGLKATPHHETVLFNLLQGFLGAFAFARLSTWGIRHGWWPSRNVVLGGRHIHHFVPGIVIAFASGIAALTTHDDGVEAGLAIPFGVGIGLTMDEAALLLDLRDVYWTREGILSVQVSLGVAAVLAATILGLRMLRRGEEKGAEEGLIPSTSEQSMASAGALA
jgi:zinc transporter ZupT